MAALDSGLTLNQAAPPARDWSTGRAPPAAPPPLLVVSLLLVLLLALAAAFPTRLSQPADHRTLYAGRAASRPPGRYPFGTDEAGRDIFTRVVHGARISLGMALGIVLIAAALRHALRRRRRLRRAPDRRG